MLKSTMLTHSLYFYVGKIKRNLKHHETPIVTAVGFVLIAGSVVIANCLISPDFTITMGAEVF